MNQTTPGAQPHVNSIGRALEELFSNPEELERLAEEHGLRAEDLDKDEFAAQLFCLRVGWRRHGLVDPAEVPGR